MITLNLKLEPTADISANELDALNQYWQQMLLEAGVDSIEPVKTAAPVGAKPIDLSMLNDFMINFSAGLATTFVIALWSWLKDPANHMTKFEFTRGRDRFIIMSTMTETEAQKLATKFAEMVQPPAPPTA